MKNVFRLADPVLQSTQNLVISRRSCAEAAKKCTEKRAWCMSCCFAHKTYCVLDVAVAVVVSQGPYNWKREIFISVFENTRSRSERTGIRIIFAHPHENAYERLRSASPQSMHNVWHHSFREPPFASVHTKTVSWRFQKLGTVLENLRFIAPENALYLC